MNETANNKNNVKKEGFFSQYFKSIIKLEKYGDFAIEGVKKTFLYILKLIALFVLLYTIATIYLFSEKISDILNKFDNNIKSLNYNNGILEINNNEKLEIENKDIILGKLLIDTSEINDEKLNKYKEDMKSNNIQFILLKDKAIVNNQKTISALTYNDFLENYKVKQFNKEDILKYISNNKFNILFSVFPLLFIYMFILYFMTVLLDALLLAVFINLAGRMSGLRMKFQPSFSIAIHSLTLSITLNILAILLNIFTGFVIKYLQIMYVAIAIIYAVTSIFMIKADLIKRQGELEKLNDLQEQIRLELAVKKEKEEDKKAKDKEKKDKEKQRDKESKKNDDEDKNPNIGEKPEESNV